MRNHEVEFKAIAQIKERASNISYLLRQPGHLSEATISEIKNILSSMRFNIAQIEVVLDTVT